MKKTVLILILSGLVLTACSKSTEKNTDQVENKTQATTTQTQTTTAADSVHQAENSLDWAGKYKGLLPCADCEGIETELTLNADKTYELEEEYKGGKGDEKKFESKGKFTFDSKGSIITLDKNADERKFFVGENFLEARNRETGTKIEGPIAEHYKLAKELN
ncbi:copper resistance protein NlpE [Acinetobacter piscicola]|uniref:copper resistance protein NlpE n=1 Tax=Acinetobacter piscicola TaxID=2006115 RepID=UPI003557C181